MPVERQIICLANSSIAVATESGPAGNYLILSNHFEDKPGDPEGCPKLLEYQLSMLSANSIPHILPVEWRVKNGLLFLYYESGSLVTLRQCINSRDLQDKDMFVILESLIRGLIESKYYFLDEKNYLCKPEYIYVEPNKMTVKTVYLPFAFPNEAKRQLTGFFQETLLLLDQKGELANAFASAEKFDLSVLLQLIKKRQFSEMILKKEEKDKAHKKPFNLGELPQEPEDHVEDATKTKKSAPNKLSQGIKKFICYMVVQMVFLGFLSVFSSRLPALGDSRITYTGIAIVLVAINILFLNYCFANKKDCPKDEHILSSEQSYELVLEKMLAREKGVLKEELSLHSVNDKMILSKQKR